MENYGTIWVCQDCMLHHANGECGSCHDQRGHDQEPLSLVKRSDGWEVSAAGETDTYSTSSCEGCGSYLHGERHAMTLFKD
ncbi:hypothetical protein [Streptomyces achromogenes]|uniref:hypothetical protein n=1 Tax=Streptomyces achromogenes TaxID=67255 RepID=UPI0036738096